MKIISETGSLIKEQFVVNESLSKSLTNPKISCHSSGIFFIIWVSEMSGFILKKEIYAKIYKNDFSILKNEFIVKAYSLYDQTNAQICLLNDNRFLIIWEKYSSNSNSNFIEGSILNLDGSFSTSDHSFTIEVSSLYSNLDCTGISNLNIVITYAKNGIQYAVIYDSKLALFKTEFSLSSANSSKNGKD